MITFDEIDQLVAKHGPRIAVKHGDNVGFLTGWSNAGTASATIGCVREIVHAGGLLETVPDAYRVTAELADVEPAGMHEGMPYLRIVRATEVRR